MTKPINRPTDLSGTTSKVPVSINGESHKMYVTVNGIDGKPLEVFASIGKAGSSVRVMADCISRLVSCQLQDGADPERLIRRHLIDMRGGDPTPWALGETLIHSIPDGVGKAVLRWMRQNEQAAGYKSSVSPVDEDVGEEVASKAI